MNSIHDAVTQKGELAAKSNGKASTFSEPDLQARETHEDQMNIAQTWPTQSKDALAFDKAQSVRIILLGHCQLMVGEEAMPLPAKAQIILAYLAVNLGTPVTRDFLADFAWPKRGPEQASQSLRQAIMAIRRAISSVPNCQLRSIGEGAVVLEGCAVDVKSLEQAALSQNMAMLEDAANLMTNAFLSGLASPGQAFDDWRIVEQNRLINLSYIVLQRLIEAKSSQNALDEAISLAQRLVALDPLREEAHRLLMSCLAKVGRRSEALRCFADCRQILQTELQVEPDEATMKLADEIRQNILAPTLEPKEQGTIEPPFREQNAPNETKIAQLEKLSLPFFSFTRLRNFYQKKPYYAGAIALLCITVLISSGLWLSAISQHSHSVAPKKDTYLFSGILPLKGDNHEVAVSNLLNSKMMGGFGQIPTVKLVDNNQHDNNLPEAIAHYRIAGTLAETVTGLHVESSIEDTLTKQIVTTVSFDVANKAEDGTVKSDEDMVDEILGYVGNTLCEQINRIAFPYDIDTTEKQQAFELAKSARYQADRGAANEIVLNLFAKSFALDPNNLDNIGTYANVLIASVKNNAEPNPEEQVHLDTAKSLIDAIYKSKPGHRLIAYARCQYFRQTLQVFLARVACDQYQQILPWAARGYKELGLVYLLQGQLIDAYKNLDYADHLVKYQLVRWTWSGPAGIISLLQNDNVKAHEWFIKSTQFNPTHPWSYLFAAIASKRLNDRAAAERELNFFKTIKPDTRPDKYFKNTFPLETQQSETLKKSINDLLAEAIRAYDEAS